MSCTGIPDNNGCHIVILFLVSSVEQRPLNHFLVNEGEILIRLSRDNNRLRIDVQDNGIGISKENQALIFKRFRQVDNPIRGRPSGTGIGLTIAQRIIEYHNGKLWVESEPGQGATFSFSLPVVEHITID